MKKRPVIIIGAGLSGLAAGCYCQMNGYSTRIFEHHSKPGGVVAAWRRKGFIIDGGIHFLMGHKPGQSVYKLYRELGIIEGNRTRDMVSYGRFIDEVDGGNVEITRDLDCLADRLKDLSPEDAKVIDELVTGTRAMQSVDIGAMGMDKPLELRGRLEGIKQMWELRRVHRYFSGKYAKSVSEYTQGIKDPFLRQFIENIFLPEVPAWFIFIILGLFAEGQLGLLEGGSLSLVRSIEQRYKALGGEIAYKATVEEILVESNKAVGVRLDDGSEHRAGVVISAADGYSTIFKMLSGRYIDDNIKNNYENWKLFRPLVMVNYGVAREFPDETPFTTIVLKCPVTVNNRPVSRIFIRIFNYVSELAPPGKTVVQAELEADWYYWNDLQGQNRARYDTEKDRIATEVLERLEAYYPGITSQVEVTDVATPYTTWRYTRNYKGAWEGWLPTPEAIRTEMKRTLPGLQNFYMAGQWVMPGGGVMPCLYSGRHVVQILCRKDRKRFETSVL